VVLLGASAVFFGVIGLAWHDADTWQSLSALWKLPSGRIVGDVLMVAQIAAGLALLLPRSRRVASIVLCVVYALFSLACIPGIIAAPRSFGQYDGFFEQFCLFCGALAVYAAAEANGSRSLLLGRVARVGLGVSVISFTLAQIVYPHETAALVPKWIPPGQMFWAVLTTVAFALAAIAILIDRKARLAMHLATLMLVLFGVLVWIPLLVAHPETHLNWSEFALTLLIAGAAWTVADPRGTSMPRVAASLR